MASQPRYNLRVKVNDKPSENDEKSSTVEVEKQLKKPKKPSKKTAQKDIVSVPPIAVGEHLRDSARKAEWRLGASIGRGGFGEIYSAQLVSTKEKSPNEFPYVVKIEPHENGPLFVEMHFLMNNGKPEDIETYKKKRNLTSVGMPCFIGCGSHDYDNKKYRFIVLEKFGSDIWKLFVKNGKTFPLVTVLRIGIQILDVLQYIHERGYVHHDIKGANIAIDSKNDFQVYLLDFGLAGRIFKGKVYKPDPKKAHDGTLEYVSRDGHKGLCTRRGDLEILGYNLIHWLGKTLPWEGDKNASNVYSKKEAFIRDIPESIENWFKPSSVPNPILEYFKYISNLEFDQIPDYDSLRKILSSDIPKSIRFNSPLQFESEPTSSIIPKKTKEMKPTKPKKAINTPKENETPNHVHFSSESSSSVVPNGDDANEVKTLNAAERAVLEKVAARANAKGKKKDVANKKKSNNDEEKGGENGLEEVSKNDRKRGSSGEANGEDGEPEDKRPRRNARARKP